MKTKDAQYYADQINLFTAYKATVKNGELIVKGIGRTRNETQADTFYQQARKHSK